MMNPFLLAILAACNLSCQDPRDKILHGLQELFPSEPEDRIRIEEGWLPVLVLADGKPCTDALVLVEPAPRNQYAFPARRTAVSGQRLRHLTPEDPGVFRTDSRGLAWWQVSDRDSTWHLSACHEGRVGFLVLGATEMSKFRAGARLGVAHFALELLPMRTLRMEIQAPEGEQSSDVPVFLTSPEGRVLWRYSRSADGALNGIDLKDEVMRDDDEYMQVLAGFDRSQMRRIEFGKKSSRLTFDLRQTGGIAVELIRADGAVVTDPRAVFLEEAEATAAGAWSGMSDRLADVPGVVSVGGSAVLRGVPLGRRWRIAAFTRGDEAAVMAEMDGPTRAGEMVRFRLDAAATSVPFTGRILEPDGSPAAAVSCRLQAGGDVFAPFQTDAEGRFATQIPLWILNRGEEMSLTCDRWPLRPQCSVRVTAADLAETVVAKDWRWTESEPLAVGRVVDESGAGIAGAMLSNRESGGLNYCDGSGHFLLMEEKEPRDAQNLTLEAHSPWHLENEIRFTSGERDLELRLSTGARIAGLHTDRRMPTDVRWEYLLPGSMEVQRGDLFQDWFSWRGGGFEIGPIPPQAIEVRIHFSDTSQELGTVTLKDLQLVAGKIYQVPQPVQLVR